MQYAGAGQAFWMQAGWLAAGQSALELSHVTCAPRVNLLHFARMQDNGCISLQGQARVASLDSLNIIPIDTVVFIRHWPGGDNLKAEKDICNHVLQMI